MNERYSQAVIAGVLVGGAILLAEIIGAESKVGPGIAEHSSPSLAFCQSAKECAKAKQLADQLAQIESMDDP